MTTLLFAFLLSYPAISAPSVPFAEVAPVIDGDPADPAWNLGSWRPIGHATLGLEPTPEDFQGRYKLVWTKDRLFLLAEIVDDVLIDKEPDPLVAYWEDDALEILIDEDASGGNHQFNFNAFAYHIGLDNQVVDIAPPMGQGDATRVVLLNDHVFARWRRADAAPYAIYWEAEIKVYGDEFSELSPSSPRALEAGKTLGLMLAYCDADSPQGRDNFMTDRAIAPVNGDRNRAYIDAGVFGQITLAPPAIAGEAP